MKLFLLFCLFLVNLLSWTLSQYTIYISHWFVYPGQFDTCVWGEINASKISDKLLEAIFIWGVDTEYKYAAHKKKIRTGVLALRIHVLYSIGFLFCELPLKYSNFKSLWGFIVLLRSQHTEFVFVCLSENKLYPLDSTSLANCTFIRGITMADSSLQKYRQDNWKNVRFKLDLCKGD